MIVFVIEVIAGVMAFVLMEHVEDKLSSFMHIAIVGYQDDASSKHSIDYIQREVCTIKSRYEHSCFGGGIVFFKKFFFCVRNPVIIEGKH